MDTLKSIVYNTVIGYARKGLNGQSFLTQNQDGTVFSIVTVARIEGRHISNVSLVVRIVGETIIIERDQNDKLLVDALVQAGIPRQQIILAYTGEPVPESA